MEDTCSDVPHPPAHEDNANRATSVLVSNFGPDSCLVACGPELLVNGLAAVADLGKRDGHLLSCGIQAATVWVQNHGASSPAFLLPSSRTAQESRDRGGLGANHDSLCCLAKRILLKLQ